MCSCRRGSTTRKLRRSHGHSLRRDDHPRQTAPADAGSVPLADSATGVRADHPAELPTRIEEREHIAAHLNNVVMSRLFSIGIGLQGMLEGLPVPRTRRDLPGTWKRWT